MVIIHQGIVSNQFSAGEVRRLECGQIKIQRSKRRAFSDGELTAKERLRLEHKQVRANRHIYRAKHNHCLSINRLKSAWALNSISNPEMWIFVQDQGNQAFVRRRSWLRRTNKRDD